jgi:flagellar motor protein MotB
VFRHIVLLLLLLLFLAIAILSSCNPKTSEEMVLAKVNDAILSADEVEEIIPDNASKEDSLYITQSYVNQWVKSQLYLSKAKENLNLEEMDFEKEIQDYKNSLIIQAYQEELLRQKMAETNISKEEIMEYYQKNKEDFTSAEKSFNLRYFIAPEESFDKNECKELIQSKNKDEAFESFCLRHALDFYIDDEKWLTAKEINSMLPVFLSNQILSSPEKQFVEYNDSLNYYAIMLFDIKEANEIKAIEMVEDEIKQILLFKKQREFLNNFEKEMISDAEKKGEIEVFMQ